MDRIILRDSHSKKIFAPYGNITGHVPTSLFIPRAEKQKPLLDGKKRRHRPRFSSHSSLKRNRSDILLSVIWYVVSFRQKYTDRPTSPAACSQASSIFSINTLSWLKRKASS